ncbi:MAG TPA: tyrosine-type recombinase/integrase [Oscillospiraceae bacterium]|nr:tyrosine-type recombinase/integrase [Oscillospiraceae bacterium]HPK34222.1 tyrosine-type recombinase/integrase [Oscillospiraceae bacterium]HPR74875.1 tyrosine-type recombinase/integrase [Oscillospiraceae bacterium]
MRERYLEYLKSVKKVRPNTACCYLNDVDLLERKIKDFGIDHFEDLDTESFGLIISFLEHEGRSSASLERFVSGVKNFYGFLVYDGICTVNPLTGYNIIHEQKKLPVILTESEVSRILAQPDIATFKGIRDRALLELSYASALRITELLALNVGDVNLSKSQILSKSAKKRRNITIYPTAVKILAEYMNAYTKMLQALPTQSAPLFVNQQMTRLTRQGFWKIIKDYSKDAGIVKEVTPLMLRQSYAFHLVGKGAGEEDIMRLMDYRNIASAKIYAIK